MMQSDMDCASHMKWRSRIFLAKVYLIQDPITVSGIVIVLVAVKKDGVQQRAKK